MSDTVDAPPQSRLALTDRFTLREGRVLITGVEALVRLMLVQADRDAAAGLRTGGFVTGYRGSPLGTLDSAFGRAAALTAPRGIVVQPAVNEEMAATAVAGSQQLERSPDARVDGVFSMWYGKGPGLDRAADAIRHGNFQGTSPHGGVVAVVGDDHLAKSSSIVCYSDETIASLQVPLLYPSDPHEIVTMGLHGFAMSRLTGSWTALKIITEVADSTRVVDADEAAMPIVLPEIEVPPGGLHNRWPELPGDQEIKQQTYRLPAIHTYVEANGLDRIVAKPEGARIGLMAAGKSWLDLEEALALLGLDEARCTALGIARYKPALIWPLEPTRMGEFAQGLDLLIVVEEKGAFIENQAKAVLYPQPARPQIIGKSDASGKALLPRTGDLTPERIAAELATVIAEVTGDERLRQAAEMNRQALATQQGFAVPPALRKPYFCSGCPHNRSTVVPEGSRALGGIGCHGLAVYNRADTNTFAQMGGEGVHWMGLAPFTGETHVFANIGDGTYFHSGIMAIRQAVAARLNLTYKLLYNSAVAMTGGQSVDGELSVAQLIEQLRAEGVTQIVVATDDPTRYPAGDPVRARADRIEHRDDIEQLQRELREVAGVSVIVYEQMCATEKRRMRKRGKLAEPARRVFINERVCEDCGDCSKVSNCLSVEPVPSEFESKRRINQSTCNKDFSCQNGFCPSFVSVEGGTLRKAAGKAAPDELAPLPQQALAEHQKLLVAGVGGTGVVTIGALLATSAHMAGLQAAVLDQVGMAQKGGAVSSHIHISDQPIGALRIPVGEADLLIACDQIVGNARDMIAAVRPGHTHVIANADVAITGDFTQNRNARPDQTLLARRLAQRAGEDRFIAFPFTRLAEKLCGDGIGSNLMMVGLAYQKGWLKLDLDAFMQAVELNGVGVGMNKAAFAWGRWLGVDPERAFAAAGMAGPAPETLDQKIDRRAAYLAKYQDEAYARRYRETIAAVRAAEARVSPETALAETAAQALFRIMAYKDEYEVARLYAEPQFAAALAEQFDGPVRLSFHLAPPIMAKRDKATGALRKREFGPWVANAFKVLRRFKTLRGTRLDPFGYTAERRMERALIGEYEALLGQITARLNARNLAQAITLAGLALGVRGYGHVKERSVEAYRAALPDAIAGFNAAADQPEMEPLTGT